MTSETHRTIEAVFRIESAKLIGALARLVRDVGRAEELAQDALVAALKQWPTSGIPDRPGAWLMATAKHLAVDEVRRARTLERKRAELGVDTEAEVDMNAADLDALLDDPLGDDLLGLVFTACHPLLSREAQVALTLRLLGGLTVDEIARAFLISPTTVQQRIVRAKKALADAKVPFEVPAGEALTQRLSSVLEVIYLIFNEGYSATTGDHWLRPELCEDAMRLGRILAAAKPSEPEVHALLSLMELQASRFGARIGRDGEAVLLLEQNRTRWDRLLIQRGLAGLDRVEALGGQRGPYALQAALAACHARALTAEQTDWQRIVSIYDVLAEAHPSPIVEMNRAIAASMAFGPEEGLRRLEPLADDERLHEYPFFYGARADMSFRAERFREAAADFERAAALTKNEHDRALMIKRASEANEKAERRP